MLEKQMVIVGLDPGTTVGYAILSLEGKLLRIESSKEFTLSKIIDKIIEFGRILAVGTDKKRTPGFIEEFAVKTGAKIISPDEDLQIKEKVELTKGFNFSGDHQQDALASAVLAYKRINPIISKISSFLEKNKKENLKNRITEIIIKNEGLNIKSAVELIEKPSETSKIIKKAVENKELKKEDFFKLDEKAVVLEQENKLLRSQNDNLKNEIKNIKRLLENRNPKAKQDIKISEIIKQKDLRLNFLDYTSRKKDSEINLLKEEIFRLSRFLSELNKNIMLKKLKNLGSSEFENKKAQLNIKEGDILLVENPNIISQDVYEKIKDKISIIVYKEKPSNKIKENCNFIFLDSKNLSIEENQYFAVTDKDNFQKNIEKTDILKRVIKEYKSNQT